ncbi:hypothetical protein CH276_22685 [Rhodococcus sp. 06-470-2]|uniref:hypothetical protein n=1 Tax=unclassified Rhodococcus (in: high G+C Gram-positive bacteria) TaxID=192944 RepID=UPI000B9BBB11|nr:MULTISPECIES: hypothetical protein [unclassified Rhodococcus (in: high G+C Gram-positive bacteria)]OZC59257.1 hypothetical protein CH276_22685 [Rhodococcus sp. 06-470-2]OZE66844.1 hypothetical protein CH265_08010 [Rhodococcus sp. 05-2221-1B]
MSDNNRPHMDGPYMEGAVLKKGDRVGVEINGKVHIDTYTPPAVRPTDEQLADWTDPYGSNFPPYYLTEHDQLLQGMWEELIELRAERAARTVEYAVKHPVNGEPRFARESLELCRATAEDHDTVMLHRYVGPWTDGEPT